MSSTSIEAITALSGREAENWVRFSADGSRVVAEAAGTATFQGVSSADYEVDGKVHRVGMIKCATFAVAKDGSGQLAGGDVALVDTLAGLPAGQRLQFLEGFGYSPFVRDYQPFVSAEERLDRDRLWRIERRVVTSPTVRLHPWGELIHRDRMVIARHAFEGLVGNHLTLDQADSAAELSEASAFHPHSFRVVVSLPQVLTQGLTVQFAGFNRQHEAPVCCGWNTDRLTTRTDDTAYASTSP
jgi:hypothetical protein